MRQHLTMWRLGRAARAVGLAVLICIPPVVPNTLLAAPIGLAQAQVVLGPAQQELKRVSAKLNKAITSGKAADLVNAVADAETTIRNAQALPTNQLDAAIKAAKTLYARAYLKLIGQLVGSCEKGHRDDGQAATTFLDKVEAGAGDVADQTQIRTYRARLAKCLPVVKYEGTYSFKSRTATSSQNYVATITWTLWQQLPGGIRTYRASGKIDATGTSGECSGSLHTTIASDLGLLTVNEITGAGVSIPDTYMFAFGSRDLMKMTCPKGEPQQEPLSGGDTCEPKPYADITTLVGSCQDSGTEGRWLFRAVKE
ncbi:hypothetical protein E7T09_06765 [Deinococcus sp. KSM4-11]|uniref:hypothetical protein n=1 Tax=Deinococcus sp. KSM4-11 TaxID=2568654 RepID=UPI0010A4026A|nr:hypothetical protein [Deinococcus sp. KSM4-11]THF88865.1 hypothetical protein E7T09_06765 [Deinococcus sp. KSM4-11]